jgi:hypothetical protein
LVMANLPTLDVSGDQRLHVVAQSFQRTKQCAQVRSARPMPIAASIRGACDLIQVAADGSERSHRALQFCKLPLVAAVL